MKKYIIYFDGASRGNPGHAGIGVVIYNNNKIEKKISEYIGQTTNNIAEYMGLIKGLYYAYENNAEHVIIYSDSELVVNQIKGKYKVRNKSLHPLYNQAIKYIHTIKYFEINHVKRHDNKIADELANKSLNNRS